MPETLIDMSLSPVRAAVRQLKDALFDKKELTVHALIYENGPVQLTGNKWHKLKYNLAEAAKMHQGTLLTFGGAWSNHIAATACAAKLYGFKSIGIIRGEEARPLNKTLSEAVKNGMELFFETREGYRKKANDDYLRELRDRFGDFYLLPEGGSNQLAVKGCAEIISDIPVDFDVICCPCGTGATLAGLVAGLSGSQQAIGISVLKGDFLTEKIRAFLPGNMQHWQVINTYHFGGYVKKTAELEDFIRHFEKSQHMKTEPVYTGKMFYGLYDLIRNDFFKPGTRIIAFHTGGLQYL